MNKSTAPPLQSFMLCAIIIIATPTGLKNSARYVYAYDNAGNILFKRTYNFTTSEDFGSFTSKTQYVYSNAQWGDLLTYYNGQNITYDEIGNPLKYYNGYRFTWNGRQMKTAFVGTATFVFQYNEDGLRTVKMKNNGEITTYYYYGNLLISEQTATETFIYHYTSGGSIIGMSYRNAGYATGAFDTYVFEKNIFGDIVAVYDLSGTKLVSYKYDAWGNTIPTYHNGTTTNSVAARNPFTYRGYYYDSDIRLYYLQTRYYDSVTGRFINADGYISRGQGLIGNNMFAYCNNNPVMFTNSAGQSNTCVSTVTAAVSVYVLRASADLSMTAPGVPRSDIANAPNLDVTTATDGSYNCYGNALKKQIKTNPTGFVAYADVRSVFEAVKADLGTDNVRELASINDPIGNDEYLVAMRCGTGDYHFIRFDGVRWYNKSGTATGVYIDESWVMAETWYMIVPDGNGNPIPKYDYELYYSGEIIYFAVKEDWYLQ